MRKAHVKPLPLLITNDWVGALKKANAEYSDPASLTASLTQQLQNAVLQLEAKQSEVVVGMSDYSTPDHRAA